MSYLRRRRAPAARPATQSNGSIDSASPDWIDGFLPTGSAQDALAPAGSLPGELAAPQFEMLFTPRALRRRSRTRR